MQNNPSANVTYSFYHIHNIEAQCKIISYNLAHTFMPQWVEILFKDWKNLARFKDSLANKTTSYTNFYLQVQKKMDNRTPFLFTYPNVKSPKHYHSNIRSYWQLKLGHLSLRPLWKLLHTHSNGSKTARSKKRLHSVEFRRDRLVLKIEPSFQIFHRVQSKHSHSMWTLSKKKKRL